jgi:hypothetical protein
VLMVFDGTVLRVVLASDIYMRKTDSDASTSAHSRHDKHVNGSESV